MIRNLVGCTLIIALGCGGSDQSVSSNERALEILDQVVLSAGGDSVLNDIVTLVAHYEFSQTGPDGETFAPIEALQVRDFETGRNLYEVHALSPIESWERVVMAPGRAFSVNLLTNETREFNTPGATMAEYSELQLRWYVYHPIAQARVEAVNLRHLGDSIIDGVAHDIISYLHNDLGEIQLVFDQPESRLRFQSWNAPGTVNQRTTLRYEQYDMVDGLPMPMVVTVMDGGTVTAQYQINGIQINVMLQDTAFDPPEAS